MDYNDPRAFTVGKVPGDKRRFFINKQLALGFANDAAKYRPDVVKSVSAELEPGQGWVAVLYTTGALPDAHDAGFEIRDQLVPFVPGKTPADWHNPVKVKAQRVSTGDGSSEPRAAPEKGVTAKVWVIADRVFADKGLDRGAIIAACEAEGINTSTAATQYSKWKKAKGL